MNKQGVFKYLVRNDLPVLGCITLFAVVMLIGFSINDAKSAEKAFLTITEGGSVKGTYPLDEDRIIDIGGKNLCVIKDGEAYMKEADCPDGLCVMEKPISKKGETIVCLPNRVILKVTEGPAGSKSEPDAVAY